MMQIGTYTELISSSSSFAHLLEDIHQQQKQESIINLQKQQSIISSIYSEGEKEEESITNIDTKQEGSIKWNVYTSYIKAGLGCVLGFLLIVLIFATHQVASLYSSWWLATWSDDESHRYRTLDTCTSEVSKNVNNLRSMTDNQWNTYRNRRFYIYCGEFYFNRN
jgi:hypothetical protein